MARTQLSHGEGIDGQRGAVAAGTPRLPEAEEEMGTGFDTCLHGTSGKHSAVTSLNKGCTENAAVLPDLDYRMARKISLYK